MSEFSAKLFLAIITAEKNWFLKATQSIFFSMFSSVMLLASDK